MFKVINEGCFQEDNWKRVILETPDRAEAVRVMRESIDAFKRLPRKERSGVVNVYYITEATEAQTKFDKVLDTDRNE